MPLRAGTPRAKVKKKAVGKEKAKARREKANEVKEKETEKVKENK